MQNNNNNIPIKEDKKSKLPTTSNSSVRYLVVGSIAAASALTILALLIAGGTAQVYAPAPPPCDACSIEGSGSGTITIPEDSEIGPAPCDNCSADINFNAFQFEKGDIIGKLTIVYVPPGEPCPNCVIDGNINSGKLSEKLYVLKGQLIPPPTCAACSSVHFTVNGKVGEGVTINFQADDDGTEGTFTGTVTVTKSG